MIRTQIQLPDELYRAAKALATREERSLAEIVRRGLESILARHPETTASSGEWKFPPPRDLHGDAFFLNPDWRYEANRQDAVREKPGRYMVKKKKNRA